MIRASQVALVAKNLPANAGDIRDLGSIPRSGRSPGEGNGNPLQSFCLENPKDRGAWWASVHRVAKSGTGLKQLSSSSKVEEMGRKICNREKVGKREWKIWKNTLQGRTVWNRPSKHLKIKLYNYKQERMRNSQWKMNRMYNRFQEFRGRRNQKKKKPETNNVG